VRTPGTRIAFIITACTLLTSVARLTPLVTAPGSTGRLPTSTLHEPLGYILLGALSSILDALTLLSPAQGWATFGTIITIAALHAVRRRKTASSARPIPPLWSALLTFVVRALMITLAIGELLVAAPRPMASLRLADRDLVAVDFHSHTSESHDGRPGFDVERDRDWERSAGFGAAYVTDHRTFNAAILADHRNPKLAGDGTVLLPGIELRNGSDHELVIGADPLKSRIPTSELRDAILVPAQKDFEPIHIRAMPGDDRTIESRGVAGTADLKAIEISDGSPRGLAQTSGDAARIERLCRSHGLACVSGSDNHGWTRTAAAWSVLRIPGWRDKTPAELDLAIRQMLVENSDAVGVLMRRRVPVSTTRLGTIVSPFVIAIVTLRELDWPMRVSWILWPWAVVGLASIPWRQRFARRRERGLSFEPLVVRRLPAFQRGGDVTQ
jgi:predicted metal-dependent phosphoesterase TrpH